MPHPRASALPDLFVPTPALATTPYTNGSTIIVPDRALMATQLGLTPVVTNAGWFDKCVKAYLTATDYLSPAFPAWGERLTPREIATDLLRRYPRDIYLQVLVALNHATHDPNLTATYLQTYLDRCSPPMAARIREAVAGTPDGHPKVLLARQPVLHAMRKVLTYQPEPGEPATPPHNPLTPPDPLTAGILLVHLAAAELQAAPASSARTIGGVPEHRAMEIVANNLFNQEEDPGSLLARTRMLWSTYGDQIHLPKFKLRARPLTLLAEATGLDFDDIAALTIAYYAHITTCRPHEPVGIDAFRSLPIDHELIETYLGLFASTPDELAAALHARPGAWQLLPFQERPLLRIGDAILVLDEQFLIERATRGLYWFVHDHERTYGGQPHQTAWNMAYADMVERRVEDQLRRMAPPLLGDGQTFFTEEDLQAAFPGTKNIDAGIDFGDQVLLAEVVTTQVTVATRENASTDAFDTDVTKFFLKKAKQLDVAAANLLRDPQPANSPLPEPARQLLPITIRGGQFPVNPVTRRHINEQVHANAWLTDARIRPLALLDLRELEACEILVENRNLTLPELITQWQESDDYANGSMFSFLATQYHDCISRHRPADLQDQLAHTLTTAATRLGASFAGTNVDTP